MEFKQFSQAPNNCRTEPLLNGTCSTAHFNGLECLAFGAHSTLVHIAQINNAHISTSVEEKITAD